MAWVAFSCDEFCEEPNRTAVVINFYSSESDAIRVSNVAITGVGNDSVLYSKSNYSQVMLPVNPSADSMRFSIEYNDLPADTIIIHYVRYNGFISSECGCVTFAELQEVEIEGATERTDHAIVQLEVTKPHVSTVSYRQGVINEENIRIYY